MAIRLASYTIFNCHHRKILFVHHSGGIGANHPLSRLGAGAIVNLKRTDKVTSVARGMGKISKGFVKQKGTVER